MYILGMKIDYAQPTNMMDKSIIEQKLDTSHIDVQTNQKPMNSSKIDEKNEMDESKMDQSTRTIQSIVDDKYTGRIIT